jgi:hypothetical protein
VKRLRPGSVTVLDILRDLMLGGSHSRTTVARCGVSLPTADRWLVSLRVVPGVSKRKVGKVTAYVWRPTRAMRNLCLDQ